MVTIYTQKKSFDFLSEPQEPSLTNSLRCNIWKSFSIVHLDHYKGTTITNLKFILVVVFESDM